MANVTFKSALNAARFPLLYATAGQEVLDPGTDVAPRVNPAFAGGVNNIDWNLIQPQYVQNMLPTEKGYRSVDIEDSTALWPAGSPSLTVYATVHMPITGTLGGTWVLGRAAGTTQLWQLTTPPVLRRTFVNAGPSFDFRACSSFVNGRHFIGVPGTPFEVVESGFAGAIAPVVVSYPVGLLADDIRGMLASGNYNVVYTVDTIYWSTPTNPLDFATVSLGAGNQIPNDLLGDIVRCVPISGGFIIYTTKNAVAAFATNNPSTPFRFVSVRESAGLSHFDSVAGDANSSTHYAMTRTGFQEITQNKATFVFSELVDYIAIGRSTKIVSADALPEELTLVDQAKQPIDSYNIPHLQLIAQRYLVVTCPIFLASISGDQKQRVDVVVYDTALNRWTRLRTGDAAASFMWGITESTYSSSAPTTFMAGALMLPSVLTPTGVPKRIQVAKTGATVLDNQSSCLIVGRVKLRRARHVTVTAVELYGSYSPRDVFTTPVVPPTTPVCTLLLSTSGADRTHAVEMILVESTETYWRFEGRATAANIDVMITGRHELTSVIVTAQNHGIR